MSKRGMLDPMLASAAHSTADAKNEELIAPTGGA